jgi:MFS superfamily sulfate permease-like transporter
MGIGILRLGFVVTFLSRPVRNGFASACTIIAIVRVIRVCTVDVVAVTALM